MRDGHALYTVNWAQSSGWFIWHTTHSSTSRAMLSQIHKYIHREHYSKTSLLTCNAWHSIKHSVPSQIHKYSLNIQWGHSSTHFWHWKWGWLWLSLRGWISIPSLKPKQWWLYFIPQWSLHLHLVLYREVLQNMHYFGAWNVAMI